MAGSPVAAMASVHAAAATGSFLALENHSADIPAWSQLIEGLPRPLVQDGRIAVPETPGLGFTGSRSRGVHAVPRPARSGLVRTHRRLGHRASPRPTLELGPLIHRRGWPYPGHDQTDASSTDAAPAGDPGPGVAGRRGVRGSGGAVGPDVRFEGTVKLIGRRERLGRRLRPKRQAGPSPASRPQRSPDPGRDRGSGGAHHGRPVGRRGATGPRSGPAPAHPRDGRSEPVRPGRGRPRGGPPARAERHPGLVGIGGSARAPPVRRGTRHRHGRGRGIPRLCAGTRRARRCPRRTRALHGSHGRGRPDGRPLLGPRLTRPAVVHPRASRRSGQSAEVDAMQAAASPGLAPENTAYVTALVGNLLVANGHPDDARAAYQPGSPSRHRARAVDRGAAAVSRSARVTSRRPVPGSSRRRSILPLPEYVVALGGGRRGARRFGCGREVVRAGPRRDPALPGERGHGRCRPRVVRGRPRRPVTVPRAGHGRLRADPDDPCRRRPRVGPPPARGDPGGGRPLEGGAPARFVRDPLLRYHAGAIEAALGQKAAARRTSRWPSRPTRGSASGAAARRGAPDPRDPRGLRRGADHAGTAPDRTHPNRHGVRITDRADLAGVATRRSRGRSQAGDLHLVRSGRTNRVQDEPGRVATVGASAHGADHRQQRDGVEPPRSPAHRRRPKRRQHRPVRVRQPGRPVQADNRGRTYVPLQQPAGGPNFSAFDDSVRYRIHIDNSGDGRDDVTYTIRFKTHPKSGKVGVSSFLYNNGQITSVNDPDWLVPQDFSVERTKGDVTTTLGSDMRTVPANIGPRSTPNYATLAAGGNHALTNGGMAFAGAPRRPVLRRPRLDLRSGPGPTAVQLAAPPAPRPTAPVSTVWPATTRPRSSSRSRSPRSASRPRSRSWVSGRARRTRKATKTIDTSRTADVKWSGPWVQVSRLRQPAHQRGRHPAQPRRTTGTASRRPTTASSRPTTRSPSWPVS